MKGMSIFGKAIADEEYITQLIQTTLQVEIGSLVMRRDWGGNVFESVDSKNNDFENAVLFAKIAKSLQPMGRFLSVSYIGVKRTSESSIFIDIGGFIKVSGIWKPYKPSNKMIINPYVFKKTNAKLFDLSMGGTNNSTLISDTTGRSTINNSGGAKFSSVVTFGGKNTVLANNAILSLSPKSNFDFSAIGAFSIEADWYPSATRPTTIYPGTKFFSSMAVNGQMEGFGFSYEDNDGILQVYERERVVASFSKPISQLTGKFNKVAVCINVLTKVCKIYLDGTLVASGSFTFPYSNSFQAPEAFVFSDIYNNTNEDFFGSFTIYEGLIY